MRVIKNVLLSILFFALSNANALSAKPLNILFVVDYFPAPGQTFILNIIMGLIDNGHKVSLFAFHKKAISQQFIQPDIEKYSLMNLVTYEQFSGDLPDCDIVFCQSASLGKQMLENERFAPWLKKRKMVVALRGHDITSNEIRNDPSLYKILFEACDLFLPVCDYFKNIAVSLGCNSNKIIVYHSAINCSKFFFREKKPIGKEKIQLISVCRLVEKKGLDVAIRAVAALVKKYKNIHFTIIGRGRLRSSLEQLVKQLKIDNKVSFFGWGTQDQIIQMLDQSHIFLLPSITAENGDEEGIANALKEAMAMGLVSIGTWHAGTPELIQDGVSGFLVPEKNSDLLAQKIKYVIEHPELWKAIGIAARKKIEDEFETKKSIEELERIFYTLLESH